LAVCFSESAKQIYFWYVAMALVDELASFNIMVEKWDSSKIGGKRGAALIMEARIGQGLHDSKGGHIQHTGCCSRPGELNPESGCGHAGCP
jgi:hypothetical protein